jgi:site-specific DNA-methyltransferase (adenine-specific)
MINGHIDDEIVAELERKMELNKIYNMDCVEGMKMLPDNSIDLTVTSPPYDNLRTYNGFSWDFEATAKELYRVTKQGGVVVWVVGDSTVKGSETGTSFKQALFFKECGFSLHDTMIWRKTNPMPKVKTKRYFDVFEYMFIFSKGTPKTFNPIMQQCKTGGKKYDSTCKNMGGENGRTKKSFVLNNERYKDNIWDIAIAQNKTTHPAVFPEQIANDHIISWSNEGDTILDCFMGSGTTGKMATLNNRKYIGFEVSKEYCDIAEQRIAETKIKLTKRERGGEK